MPHEDEAFSAHALSARALELWQGLSGLYDEIESALRADDAGSDLAGLGKAIVAAEGELRPLVARIAEIRSSAIRPGPELVAIWEESDRLVADLAARQPALARAAMAAREGASRALARLRSVRRDAAAYRVRFSREPQFASRQA